MIREYWEMNVSTAVAALALAVIVFLALRYIIKEKRKGSKCIGCPYADSCGRDCHKD